MSGEGGTFSGRVFRYELVGAGGGGHGRASWQCADGKRNPSTPLLKGAASPAEEGRVLAGESYRLAAEAEGVGYLAAILRRDGRRKFPCSLPGDTRRVSSGRQRLK